MKKTTFLFTLLIALISCREEIKKPELQSSWTSLWNGKDLSGWHTYLGTPFNRETDSLGNSIAAFGVDHDPMEIIKVVETPDGSAIRISGVAWGMLYSEAEFKNYHLKLKVKWGEDMHAPREKGPRDSGLLYHGFGEPGSANYWMGSQELQVQEGDMGDYWPVGDVAIDIPSEPLDDKYYIYKEGADLRTYYFAEILESDRHDSLAKRRVFKGLNAEKPHGQWNEVELVVLGDSSVHIVNGKVVMRLFNSRKMSSGTPLNYGRIILQSEGAEVFYKDIILQPIKEVPEAFE